jgi:long-chain acyl-CoA synthetase
MTQLAELLFDETGDPEQPLVHVGGHVHSRAEVRRRAEAIADALASAGVGEGRPVGVMLPNDWGVIATLFGVWRVGAVYAPLNPRLGTTDLGRSLEAVRPAAIVTTEDHAARFSDLPLVLVGADIDVRPGIGSDRTFDPDVALVQFTSGTTGPPKAVPLRHSTVVPLLDNVLETLRNRPADGRPPMANIIPVSLSLWAGLYQVLFAMRVGAPIVLMEHFDSREFAALVAEHAIRSAVLPPAAMTTLADDERVTSLQPLKYVRSITAPLSPLQARRFRDRFGIAILNCYGQTEIGGEIVGWSAADARQFGDTKLGAAGRPHADVELRTNPNTGELEVRTPSMPTTYADGSDLSDRLSSDGWFRTGDIAHIDEDGFLWIDGRVSDMINRGGLKVFPAEVEEVLRLVPGVADVAVVGMDDDRRGAVPWAFIVPGDRTPSSIELEERCREHLAPYKIPVRFELVDRLPRNEVGKVLVRELSKVTPKSA